MSTLVTTALRHNASASNNMVLDSSGRVGINNAAPVARLAVSASANEASQIAFDGNSNGVYPADFFGGSIGYNFSAGGAEVDLWNNWSGAGATQGGFFFRKRLTGSTNLPLMSIRGDGLFNTPQQPFAYIEGAPVAFESTATTGVITGGTQIFNTGSMYNSSNGRFTAPIAGNYFVSFSGITQSSDANDTSVAAEVNGVFRGRGYSGGYSGGSIIWRSIAFIGVFKLNAGDFITFNKQIGTIHSNSVPYRTVYLLG